MARTRTPKAEPTGTVQARHKFERQRQKEARAARAELMDETLAAQKATAKFLASKPADSRNLDR